MQVSLIIVLGLVRVSANPFHLSQPWDYIILDEGHNIKNHNSMTANELKGIPSHHRLVMTGTPMQNRLSVRFMRRDDNGSRCVYVS
jgi:superfamily II DNA or RNA helicase